VLIHATFFSPRLKLAERLHSTSTMAAQVASGEAADYDSFQSPLCPGNDLELKDLLQEARAIFPNTEMAYDFLTYGTTTAAKELSQQASEQARESAEEGMTASDQNETAVAPRRSITQAIAERPTD